MCLILLLYFKWFVILLYVEVCLGEGDLNDDKYNLGGVVEILEKRNFCGGEFGNFWLFVWLLDKRGI